MTATGQELDGKLSADTSLVSGANKISGARDWTVQRENGLLVLGAPEGDTQLVLVEVSAANAPAATAAAWARYQPAFKRTIRQVTRHPATNGWQQHTVTQYETSPNEKRQVEAHALRNGASWTVLLIDGSEHTLNKREAAHILAVKSLQPKDYVRESFAGRVPMRLDAGRQQQVRSFLRDSMKTLGIPGLSYALLDRGKVVFEGGLGVRELGKPAPVDEHTLFMAASNTKGMTTLLLSTLVDEGKIKWDQPVTQVYPDFKLGNAETTSQVLFKHLVCACTGLPRKDLEMFFEYEGAGPEYSLKLLSNVSPTSGFGEVYQYNNLMPSAAGYIAGQIVYPGKPLGAAYDEAMQNRIFTPLGMNSSTFDMERALRSNHASAHATNLDGKIEVMPMYLNYNVLPHRPGGGVWTSAHDMSRYVMLEANQGKLPDGTQMVSADALLARRAPQISEGENSNYGMGLSLATEWGVPVLYHGGSLFGFKSNFYLLPDSGIGVVLLTNSDQGALLERPLLRRLLEIVYDGKPEAVETVRLVAERDAHERMMERRRNKPALAAAAGLARRYRSPELGELTVHRQGKEVVFDFGEWKSPMGARKNEDGSLSFVTTAAGMEGFEFVAGGKSGQRTLLIRDGQHEYTFKEI
ncbi:class A beta-lactamase-related serine hydrolase [Massilia horti]|uniref:Class A beta-lactamase-related serine hydrolase n=2 Tax=Massilia horti TaxID=2562153 RepID=A0A4Y9SQE5_9BURK|nr:class A beta-lactamase-related serine hydrolase [Massilia horti]